ncbi:MAG TPA: hypothetical protein VH325_14215 [Bryobacteraceae bacterium]|jgi:hypothetical protein|nr:hypothetical protein [Bryobacteraceae bacterium]
MIKLISLYLIAAATTLAASATITLVDAGNPLVSDGANYVGLYDISVNGIVTPALCVDVQDDSYVGQQWTATITQGSPTGSVIELEEMWLFAADKALSPSDSIDRVNIQNAAWNLGDPAYAADPAAQQWEQLAAVNYSSVNSYYYFFASGPGVQTMLYDAITTTPEPTLLALFGLLILAGSMIVRQLKRKG